MFDRFGEAAVIREKLNETDRAVPGAESRQPWQAPILRTLGGNEAEHGDSGSPEAITFS